MKRMALIAVALCVIVLTTVGAGAVAAKQGQSPPGKVKQFDVTYNDNVVGKLSINTNTWKYVLNARGLPSDTLYYLYLLGMFPYIDQATTNENGDLHMQGVWAPQLNGVTADTGPSYILSPTLLVGQLGTITGPIYASTYGTGSKIVLGATVGTMTLNTETGAWSATINGPVTLTTPGDDHIQLAVAIPNTNERYAIGFALLSAPPFTMTGTINPIELPFFTNELSCGGVFVYYTFYPQFPV